MLRAMLLLLLACAGPGPSTATDVDADGFSADVDCNDADASVHPGAPERCDGVDANCDARADELDADADGTLDCAVCDSVGYFAPLAASEDVTVTLPELTAGVDCTYDRAREWLFTLVDEHDGVVTCVYTGKTFAADDYPPDWDLVNTEHTWPQSQGASSEPAKCDLGHLYVADADANNARGDLPFGEVVGGVTWSEGGSQRGDDANGDVVFEPRDDHKGNVARSMAYFAMRYGHDLTAAQRDLFRRWDAADPVTATDRARETQIVRAQGTVNPFVACPTALDRWWEAP